MARTTTIKVDRPARTPMTSLSRIHAQTTRTTSAARRMAMLGRRPGSVDGGPQRRGGAPAPAPARAGEREVGARGDPLLVGARGGQQMRYATRAGRARLLARDAPARPAPAAVGDQQRARL